MLTTCSVYVNDNQYWPGRSRTRRRTFRTRFAPLRKPCAETARLSIANVLQHFLAYDDNRSARATVEDPQSLNAEHSHPYSYGIRQRETRNAQQKQHSSSKGRILTCLVLQLVQPLSSLCDLCDVFPHDAHGVVDLLLDGGRLGIASGGCAGLAACGSRGVATAGAGDIWVVWVVGFRPKERRSVPRTAGKRNRMYVGRHAHD